MYVNVRDAHNSSGVVPIGPYVNVRDVHNSPGVVPIGLRIHLLVYVVRKKNKYDTKNDHIYM